MAIEINNLPPAAPTVDNPGQAPVTADNATDGKTGSRETGTAPIRDQVSLTPEARKLQALETRLADQPVVDDKRVDAIKEALANGSYEIDADRIAGKMMSLEKALSDLG